MFDNIINNKAVGEIVAIKNSGDRRAGEIVAIINKIGGDNE